MPFKELRIVIDWCLRATSRPIPFLLTLDATRNALTKLVYVRSLSCLFPAWPLTVDVAIVINDQHISRLLEQSISRLSPEDVTLAFLEVVWSRNILMRPILISTQLG